MLIPVKVTLTDYLDLQEIKRDPVVTTCIIECPSCEGDRGHEVPTHINRRDGSIDGYWERCPTCRGKGEIEVEVCLIDQDDLEERDREEWGGADAPDQRRAVG